MSSKPQAEQYSDKETKERFEAALRGARLVGHKQQSEMRLGKAKPNKSPRKQKAVKKSRQ